MHKNFIPAAVAATTLLLPLAGHAQVTTGTDNAGNYSGNYASQNMGTGFGAFSLTSTNNGTSLFAGTYINGNSAIPISNGGNTFGVYANGGSTATITITRPFATALQNVGDSFSAALDTNFNNANAGQTFLFSVGPATLTLTTAGYSLTGGTVVSTLTPSDFVLNTTFRVLAANQYMFTVTGNQGADAATVTGTLPGAVNQFQITDTNTANDQFFNNLSVTNVAAAPEPSGVASLLIGAGVLGGAIIVRRRRQTA